MMWYDVVEGGSVVGAVSVVVKLRPAQHGWIEEFLLGIFAHPMLPNGAQ